MSAVTDRVPPGTSPPLDFPVISLHMPKAAGTTFHHLLASAFGESHVLLDYADDPANPVTRYCIDPDYYLFHAPASLGNYRAVHGHFAAYKYRNVPGAFRLTFLRHPVDNMISIYYFWMSQERTPSENPIHTYCRDQNLGLLDLARIPKLRFLYSKTYFGDYDPKKFDFIGDYGDFPREMARLERALGIHLPSIVWLNRTSASANRNSDRLLAERAERTEDPAIRLELAKILKEDIEFYENYRKR